MRIFGSVLVLGAIIGVIVVMLFIALGTKKQITQVREAEIGVKPKLEELQRKAKERAGLTEGWPRYYEGKGRVVSVDLESSEVLLDHEEIPGSMPAMIRSYGVEDRENLETLSPGDEVRFTLKETEDTLSIVKIEKAD